LIARSQPRKRALGRVQVLERNHRRNRRHLAADGVAQFGRRDLRRNHEVDTRRIAERGPHPRHWSAREVVEQHIGDDADDFHAPPRRRDRPANGAEPAAEIHLGGLCAHHDPFRSQFVLLAQPASGDQPETEGFQSAGS
jgi:hypothetical protein